MEQNKLLEADYLDIIFDQRNKLYGGYELRRNYNKRLKKAGLFALLGVVAVFSFSFIAINSGKREAMPEFSQPTVVTTIDIKPKIEPVQPKEVIPPPPPPAPSNTKLFTSPVITHDDKDPGNEVTTMEELKNGNSGLSNTPGDSSVIGSGDRKATVTTTTIPIPVVTNTIPSYVEQMPRFEGDLNSYLASHMVYPAQAKDAGLEGKVGIQFVINEDGSIGNLKVIRSLGGGCDEEALRVLAAMPKWKPGRNNGVPVKVMYTQPITFKLQ